MDRINPISSSRATDQDLTPDIDIEKFIPSVQEQRVLMDELILLFATSVIKNIPKMTEEFTRISPEHFNHVHSVMARVKTKQV